MINMRYIAAAFLIIVIGGMGVMLYKDRDTIFRHDISIYYPDGCEEKYVNGKLVSPNCTRGRLILENGSTPIWNANPNNLILNKSLMNIAINLS